MYTVCSFFFDIHFYFSTVLGHFFIMHRYLTRVWASLLRKSVKFLGNNRDDECIIDFESSFGNCSSTSISWTRLRLPVEEVLPMYY